MVAESEIRRIGDVNIIFCSDNYILDVNLKYLQHDYFTDIITFDYSHGRVISGDMFISLDTVASNAAEIGAEFSQELLRRSAAGHGAIRWVTARFQAFRAMLGNAILS